MFVPYRCIVCEKEELRCECHKYCYMCEGSNDLRLCSDGMYYCLECRQACDMEAQPLPDPGTFSS